MPTYITLFNWTDQGIRDVKGSPQRQHRFEESLGQAGGRLIELYMTMGAYDFVGVWEAPDAAAAARAMLTLESAGNVRTTTLTAFPSEQAEQIIGSLG